MAHAMRSAARPARAAGRAVASALDEATRRELQQLHADDPLRWTAATLAARYGVERARVTAVLRLGVLRAKIEARPEHEAQAAAVGDAWRKLGASGAKRRPPPAPAPAPTEAVEAVQPAAVEEGASQTEAGDAVGTTETARWAREAIANGGFETARKCSFAFIEVGKGLSDEGRAVWLRDARSGLLRAPTPAERRRILGLRTVVE